METKQQPDANLAVGSNSQGAEQESAARPICCQQGGAAGYAVQAIDGSYFVGIWKDRGAAEIVLGKGKGGEQIVPLYASPPTLPEEPGFVKALRITQGPGWSSEIIRYIDALRAAIVGPQMPEVLCERHGRQASPDGYCPFCYGL